MMVEMVILAVITLVLVAVLFLINNDDKPFYKSVRTKNVPIGDPKRNKQRKIRIQIVRDANVTPANGAKCAKIIKLIKQSTQCRICRSCTVDEIFYIFGSDGIAR